MVDSRLKTSLISLLSAGWLGTSSSASVKVPVRIPTGNRHHSGGFSEEGLVKRLFKTSREEEASGGNSVGMVEPRKEGLPARTVVLEGRNCFWNGSIMQGGRRRGTLASLLLSSFLLVPSIG